MVKIPHKLLLPFTIVGTTTSITNVVSTTAVYTFASPPAVVNGSVVTVTGATPTSYNIQGSVVSNVTGNTFSADIGTSGIGNASVQGVTVLL